MIMECLVGKLGCRKAVPFWEALRRSVKIVLGCRAPQGQEGQIALGTNYAIQSLQLMGGAPTRVGVTTPIKPYSHRLCALKFLENGDPVF